MSYISGRPASYNVGVSAPTSTTSSLVHGGVQERVPSGITGTLIISSYIKLLNLQKSRRCRTASISSTAHTFETCISCPENKPNIHAQSTTRERRSVSRLTSSDAYSIFRSKSAHGCTIINTCCSTIPVHSRPIRSWTIHFSAYARPVSTCPTLNHSR